MAERSIVEGLHRRAARRPASGWWSLSGLAAGLLVACQTDPGSPPELVPPVQPSSDPTRQQLLILGCISSHPASKIERWQPLADHLAAALGEHDVEAGQVRVAEDMATMAAWLASGEVDLFSDSLFPTMYVSLEAGTEPMALRRQTPAEKWGVFITRPDSGLRTLADLAGRTIALEERESTSGYLLPLARLLGEGLQPVERRTPAAAVGEGQVGFTFTTDDENTLLWVIEGRVVAGAVDRVLLEGLPEATRAQLSVLGVTESVLGDAMVLASPATEPARLEAIRRALEGVHRTPEGRAILGRLGSTELRPVSAEDLSSWADGRRLFEMLARADLLPSSGARPLGR